MKSRLAFADPYPQTVHAEWRSFGEWLIAIKRTADGDHDQRLVSVPTSDALVRAPSGANENDPSAGGFLAPTVYADEIVASLYEEAVIAPLCDVTELGGPLADISVPGIDETSRADGSRWGGALAYWQAEGNSIPPSKPRFRSVKFSPKKIIAVVYATEELFRDVVLLEKHVRRALASELSFKLDLAVLSGSGVGVPQGVLNSPALIRVAKESGQAPGTIIQENISKMWSRLASPCRRRAIWFVNEDVDTQLDEIGASNPMLYLPAGFNGNPYAMLKGRPVVPVEQAPILGAVGDIVLADMTQYTVLHGPPQFVLSADVAFLTDELAWRFALRVDGSSAWASPITAFNGSSSRAPFAALAPR